MGFDASMIWSAISGFETIFRADFPPRMMCLAQSKKASTEPKASLTMQTVIFPRLLAASSAG